MTEEPLLAGGGLHCTDSELSWATGSGLPICCISGLAVAEYGTGSGCRALEKCYSLQTFWEPLLEFYKVALRTCETDMETNRQPGGNGGRGVSVNPLC